MTKENINEIKERVEALLRKASDGASSAAEAEAAMRLAQKLMAKYQVTEADLAKGGNEFKEAVREGLLHAKTGQYYLHPVERYCANLVGRFCAVIPLTSSIDGGLSLKLFGHESDVELANWMLSAFVKQFEADWERYKMVELQTKRLVTIKEARLSFANGFTTAINERLKAWMFRDEQSPAEGSTEDTAFALTIKKTSVVEAELQRRLAEKGLVMGTSSHRGNRGNHSGAAGAGYASGSRVDTGRGVGKSAIMIGGR